MFSLLSVGRPTRLLAPTRKKQGTADMDTTTHKKQPYSTGEEIASAITHGIGAAFGVAALILLLVRSVLRSDGIAIVAVLIYGVSLILLYLMSTLYHALTPIKAKKVFKVLDHSSVYLLIAGTYTVYTLAVLRNALGWTIFGIIWGLAITGIALEAFWVNRSKIVSAILFVAMGWIVVFAIKPIKDSLSPESFALLVSGGIAYSLGAVVYVMKKIKWSHPIWHLFVLAGSVLHFLSIWKTF
jgi:hemolysin III